MLAIARRHSRAITNRVHGRRLVAAFIGLTPVAVPLAHADTLATPSFSGPLEPNPEPLSTDIGAFGTLSVTGQLTGIAVHQSNAGHDGTRGTRSSFFDIANAQVEVQTTGGPVELYAQAGTYSIMLLGSTYLRSWHATHRLFGPVPEAYAKVHLTPSLSLTGGILPVMVGAESNLSFQNFNIERGLLCNQAAAFNRAVQLNYGKGPISAAFSVGDGYFSGKMNWLSGSFSYAPDKDSSITFIGSGSVSRNAKSTYATPLLQNNGSLWNIVYSRTVGNLTLVPYLQLNHVGRDQRIGIHRSATAYGGALLAKYGFGGGLSLGARGEYVASSGGSCGLDAACTPTNLLYGPKSRAWSLTATPTYQKGVFFIRGEGSYTRLNHFQPGLGFGRNFDKSDQVRLLVETGILF